MATSVIENGRSDTRRRGLLWLLLAVLGGALAFLCREGFKPNHVMWVNDFSLGALSSESSRLPSGFFGLWLDHWWIGQSIPSPSPSLGNFLIPLLSPALWTKVFAPFTMLFLGFSAWIFFRQLKFAPMVCVVGGVAAGLNMHCFSVACWGLGTWNLSIAMTLLAMSALLTDAIRQTWIKAAMAGLAVGLAVMEGFDSGAILSMFVGAFIVFLCWTREPGIARKIGQSLSTGGLVVLFAFFIAASTIWTLVGTSIVGITGTGQSEQEKSQHWYAASAGSLPKMETLRVIIPGFFGYRLENYDTTPDHAGIYWGRVNGDPHIDLLESSDPQTRVSTAMSITGGRLPQEDIAILSGNDAAARAAIVDALVNASQMQRRHSGSGEYAGILVALLAVFALASSARAHRQPYSIFERRLVWFCGGAALFSLVAAWGRHAFLYALLYKLPYFSTIRNPIKFLHPFHLFWLALAGFGLEALWRGYLKARMGETSAVSVKTKEGATWFEKGWMAGLVLLAAVLALAYWMYGPGNGSAARNFHQAFAGYIQHQGFDDDLAQRIAAFALGEVGWFVLFFAASTIALVCILAGVFRGRRAGWAWFLLTAIIVCDLSRADRPWVRYFNYKETYALNPILDFLRQHPSENRVAAKVVPNDFQYGLCPGNFGLLGVACHWWLENDWPYYGIQSIDSDQMPRVPVLESGLFATFAPRYARDLTQSDFAPPYRLWRLANARYLLCPAALVQVLNDRADPVRKGFEIRRLFNLVPKKEDVQPVDGGDLTAVLTDKGPFALVEITDALPRAKLYSNWQVPADDAQGLQILNTPEFDPEQTVLVANSTPIPPAPAKPGEDPGTVRITDYHPKDVQLQATANGPAVLLLNDRTDPSWRAWVDQKPVPILRCNHIMRGVYLTAGEHVVEFRFQPPLGPLYLTMAAIVTGLMLAGYSIYARFTQPQVEIKPEPPPQSAAPMVPVSGPTIPTKAAARPKAQKFKSPKKR